MSRLGSALSEVVRALESQGIPSALVGGLAVSVRAEPRFTRDVDLAVAAASDLHAEAIVNGLIGRGYRTLAIVEQVAASRLATVRLMPPLEPGVVVDLLFASSGIEQEIVDQAESIEVFQGVRVPVARIGHLIALKLLARNDDERPQDAWDLRVLVSILNDEEEQRARGAVRAISERGFARGRGLENALDELLASARPSRA